MPLWSRRSPSSLFEQRFEADGDEFVFRMGRHGKPVRVSLAERNDLVAQFRHAYRVGSWLMFGLLLMAIAVLCAIYIPRDQEIPERLMQTTVWLTLTGFVAGYFWLWFAPNRSLAGRNASGAPLSRVERRDLAIDKFSWFQALGFIPIGALLVADAVFEERLIPQIAKGLIGLLLIALCVRAVVLKVRRRRASTPAS